jgi:hypothetical protein
MGDTVEGYLGLFEILFSVLKKCLAACFKLLGSKDTQTPTWAFFSKIDDGFK